MKLTDARCASRGGWKRWRGWGRGRRPFSTHRVRKGGALSHLLLVRFAPAVVKKKYMHRHHLSAITGPYCRVISGNRWVTLTWHSACRLRRPDLEHRRCSLCTGTWCLQLWCRMQFPPGLWDSEIIIAIIITFIYEAPFKAKLQNASRDKMGSKRQMKHLWRD